MTNCNRLEAMLAHRPGPYLGFKVTWDGVWAAPPAVSFNPGSAPFFVVCSERTTLHEVFENR